MQPVEIRSELIDALRLDLVGPDALVGNATELLNQFPSRWYLTGFLVPTDASDDQKQDDDADDEMEELGASGICNTTWLTCRRDARTAINRYHQLRCHTMG